MKKLLSISMVVFITISALFIGCSNKKENSTNSKNIPELVWYIFAKEDQVRDLNLVLEKANEITTKKIGAKLLLKPIENAAFEDKITLIINSGEKYDLCFTSNWRNKIDKNVAKGAFTEITDKMLKENAPNIYNDFPKDYFKYGMQNGKIYAILNIQNMAYGNMGLNIQKAIAEKYSFDSTPKTIDQIKEFLINVAKSEPNLYSTGINREYTYLKNRIEKITDYAYINIDDKSLKVKALVGSDFEKEVFKLNREMFDKKAIRQDIASVTDGVIMSDRNSNKYVAQWLASYIPGDEIIWSARQKMEYIFVPVKGYENYSYLGASAGNAAMTAISYNSPYKEKSLQLINLVNTDKELYNLLVFGLEGTHYKKIPDGSIELLAESKYNMSQLKWVLGNTYNSYTIKGQDKDYINKIKYNNERAEKSPITGFVFNTEAVSSEISQLATIEKEFSNFEYLDMEESYNLYLNKMKNAGIDKLVLEIQKQLDEWKLSSK